MSATDTKQIIWATVNKIPQGNVATYGQIAKLSGLPNGARQVGYALRTLHNESRIPWHRVINAQGRLSFPVDSSAYKEQTRRLQQEGIKITCGKINLKQFAWTLS